MAHITEIKIDGLLDRKEQIHIKLNRRVNIFFGENGCGKTTLLKILDAALSRDAESMNLLPVQRAEIHIYSVDQEKTIKHVWERSEKALDDRTRQQMLLLDRELSEYEELVARYAVRTASENDWKLTPTVRPNPGSGSKRWAHTFLPTTRLYLGDTRFRAATENKSPYAAERQLDQAFAESVNRAWLHFYSKTLLEVRQIQEEGLRTVLKHVLNPDKEKIRNPILDAVDVHHRVAKFLSRQPHSDSLSLGSVTTFKRRYEEDENLRRIVDNLDNVERRIENAMAPIDRFTSTIKGLFSRGKSIVLTNNELQVLLEDGKSISLANLSSGEKHLIKIFLSAMTADHNAILIDEPELSMHIDWQRTFVRTVQSLNPDCQIIGASHSPEIMADVSDNCIFKL
jgi:predicted ATP-dependent endonuclease of OLD family